MTDAVEELAFTHLNLDVRDLDVSERFYGDVLGMPIERRDATLRLCRPGFLIVLARGEPKMGGVYVGRIADPDGYPIEIYADLPAA